MRPFVVWTNLSCEYGSCSWAMIDGLLTVRTASGSKTTELGGHEPESLARILIREIERRRTRRERAKRYRQLAHSRRNGS